MDNQFDISAIIRPFQFWDSNNPPIINGYQMPLHRNEGSAKDEETFIKENHILSREMVTVLHKLIRIKVHHTRVYL